MCGCDEMTDSAELSESEATYLASLRYNVRGLWTGAYTPVEFVDNALTIFRREFPRAWAEGAARCGIRPDEYSDAERAALEDAINQEVIYAVSLASDIVDNNKAAGGKLGALLARLPLWVNRLRDLRNRAALMACGDKKMEWVYGDTQHCDDCAGYHGKVYRASTWARYGVSPQSRCLACRGYRCRCTLVPTDKPASKGRPKGMTYC